MVRKLSHRDFQQRSLKSSLSVANLLQGNFLAFVSQTRIKN